MESKNVKVIDEHSIDRNANIICGFDVDGSDYVAYWIERDNENDNFFVSKLTKNNDGTSNMINIDDSMEKGNVSDIVKELVTYSINNEADTIANNSVTLPSGRVIDIFPVLFNKEQNINVQKTYITTVKKTVTRVTEKFYKVSESVSAGNVGMTVQPVIEEIPVVETPVVAVPKVEIPVETEVNNTQVTPLEEEVKSVNVNDELITEAFEPVVEPVESAPAVPESVVQTQVVEPISNVETPVVAALDEAVVAPSVEPIPVENPSVIPVVEKTPEVVVQPSVAVNDTSVAPVETGSDQPVLSAVSEPIPVQQPMTDFSNNVNTNTDSPLFFDASKESNLNVALGEMTSNRTVPVDNVEPIREFGQDEPVNTTPISQAFDGVEQASVNTETVAPNNNAGFANNKFFMVIAIAFFLASCVFLGYEVFKYFQLQS